MIDRTWVLSAMMVVSSAAGASSMSTEDDFAEAVRLTKAGKPGRALPLFQAVLAQNPGNEKALEYLEIGGRQVFLQMLMEQGQSATIARRFLELARVPRRPKVNDRAAIRKRYEQAMKGDDLSRRQALRELRAHHGEYGAAPFLRDLGSEESTVRVNALYCLTRMGRDAVNPLLAAIHSDDERTAWNAVAALGNIGDSRAVPFLKSEWERTESETVRDAAAQALVKIAGKAPNELPDQETLHGEAAAGLFRGDQRVFPTFLDTAPVWRWQGERVVLEEVPASLHRFALAESHCMSIWTASLARSVFLACCAAQRAELQAAAEMGQRVDGADERIRELALVLSVGTPDDLSAALEFARENEQPAAVVELIEALASTGASLEVLERTLESPSKEVRDAAAFALAQHGEGSAPAVSRLVEALHAGSVRTVLIVDPREQSRHLLTKTLENAGFAVISESQGASGFARMNALPPKDVVLVRSDVEDVSLDRFVFEEDYRSTNTSLVILTEAAIAAEIRELYQGKGRVAGFLHTPLGQQSIVEVVRAALPALEGPRAKAEASAVRAAQLLAELDSELLAPMEEELVDALDHEDEQVLGSILRVIQTLGAASASSEVGAVFTDQSRSRALRMTAAGALREIFARMSASPDEELVERIQQIALDQESPTELRMAASRALAGAAFLDADQKAELLRRQRGL